MKNLYIAILLSICGSFTMAQQPFKVIIGTTQIDSLELFEKNDDGTETPLRINKYNREGGGYIAKIYDSAKTWFRVNCKCCKSKLTLGVFDPQKGIMSFPVNLEDQGEIAYNDCFSKLYNDEHFDSSEEANVSRFMVEIQKLRHSSNCRPAMLGGPDPENAQMAFYESDSMCWFQSSDFEASWISYYPVKSIYIISHDYDVVLESKNAEQANKWLSKTQVLETEVPKRLPIEIDPEPNKYVDHYQMDFNAIASHLIGIKAFKQGVHYQLGVVIDNPNEKYCTYLLNFRLFLDEELKQVQEFFELDNPLRTPDKK